MGIKLKVDKGSDALYLRLDETRIVESKEVETGIVLDYDAEGNVVGIEILNLSSRIDPAKLNILQFETV